MSEEPVQWTENTKFGNKDNAIGKTCTEKRYGEFSCSQVK